jgi:hypothetical protein
MRRFVALALALIPFSALGGFPKNDLHLQDCLHCEDTSMTEEQFKAIIKSVADVYEPIVAKYNASLVIEQGWTESTVNAYATQQGNKWVVKMFGGLARRKEVTHDGFALVVCHEIGHHLGGYPFTSTWAANEGQSDYFATQACAKKLWGSDAPRIQAAGQSLANLLSALGGSTVVPSPDTKDPTVVTKTRNSHPAAQCRLDTYLAGMNCSASFPDDIIPGKGAFGGKNTLEAQQAAFKYSCVEGAAARPACWFAPLKDGLRRK